MQPAQNQPSTQYVRPTPSNRMKVHLRVVTVQNHTYRIVTVRPQVRVYFSTNYFHNTWHIVTDVPGTQLLSRLMWGLAYQRQPGTVVLIDKPHLCPTPFEAEPSSPILILPSHLTGISEKPLRELKHRLGGPNLPSKTIRWQTFGLDQANQLGRRKVYDSLAQDMLERYGRHWWSDDCNPPMEQMTHTGGFICYRAVPEMMRYQALLISQMRPYVSRRGPDNRYDSYADGSDYHYMDGYNGEVQIFADYRQQLSAAIEARRVMVSRPNSPEDRENFNTEVGRLRSRIIRSRIRKDEGYRQRWWR